MTYLEKNLLPDERIIYRTKKNYIVFLAPFLWFLVSMFLYFSSIPYVSNLSILAILLMVLTGTNQSLIYFTADFAITNKRVFLKEGFFIRHINETRLSTIANVSVNQSLLGQVLNYGMVVIHSFGDAADRFSDIDNPNEFKNKLQEQLDILHAPQSLKIK